MTREQILSADPITLTVEAHRILGRTIEKHEAGGRWPSGNEEPITNWRCVCSDGSEWSRVYCDCESPTVELIDKLDVENYAESWDCARELFEHELWPETASMRIWKRTDGPMIAIYGMEETIDEKSIPLAITRAFVLGNCHEVRMKAAQIRMGGSTNQLISDCIAPRP